MDYFINPNLAKPISQLSPLSKNNKGRVIKLNSILELEPSLIARIFGISEEVAIETKRDMFVDSQIPFLKTWNN